MASSKNRNKYIDDRFQVFKTGIEDVSVATEQYVEHRPLSQPKRRQRIDIIVPKSYGNYYDLSRSYLRISVKITKSGGGALDPNNENDSLIDRVAFCQSAPIFSAMSFFVSNEDFSRDVTNLLPYKNNIDLLLYKSREYLESTAAASHFFYDTASAMGATKPDSATGANAGLLARYEITKNGNFVTFESPLILDLAQSCNSYLPTKVELRLSLYPSSEPFCLITSSETELYEIEIDNVVFCLMCVTPMPEILSLHEQRFQKENAMFTYDKSMLKSYTIGTGDSNCDLDNIFGDLIPHTLHICFVKTKNYVGDYNTNCFQYEHLNVTTILFKCEGVPEKILTPDFSSASTFVTEYMNLYRSPSGATRSGIITMADFKAGYPIFKIYIVESMFKTKKGVNRLSIRFGTPLSENVTVLVYGKFSASFELSSSRHVV